MPDLASVLTQAPGVQWIVGKVIYVGGSSVTVESAGTRIPNVGFVDQYVPAIGDTVHMLSLAGMGCLIFGSNNLTTAPVGQLPGTHAPVLAGPSGFATYDALTSSWTPNVVTQGPDTYGCWFYAADAFSALGYELGGVSYDIAAFEIQMELLTGGPPEFVAHGNSSGSGSFILASDMRHAPMKLTPSTLTWVPLPISWAMGMISGSVKGIAVGGGVYNGTYAGAVGTLRITPL